MQKELFYLYLDRQGQNFDYSSNAAITDKCETVISRSVDSTWHHWLMQVYLRYSSNLPSLMGLSIASMMPMVPFYACMILGITFLLYLIRPK